MVRAAEAFNSHLRFNLEHHVKDLAEGKELSILIWDSTYIQTPEGERFYTSFQFSFEIQLRGEKVFSWPLGVLFQFSFEIQQKDEEENNIRRKLDFQFSFEIQQHKTRRKRRQKTKLSILIWDSTP